jgi:hypothetical protein
MVKLECLSFKVYFTTFIFIKKADMVCLSKTMRILFSIIILFFLSLSVQAQTGDTTKRRNIIKLDMTSYALYRNALMFSYERVTNKRPNQTWAVTGGIQQFPTLIGTLLDSVNISREASASGIKLGGEYRFYLQKENKYNAPRGVYIGPYTTFHRYSNSRSLEVNNNGLLEYADFKTDLRILNIGVQLGYQFVINNRWTIDMVFVGPSISNYSLKSKLEGNYTFDPDNITNKVILALIDKYPAFEQLINENEFTSRGRTSKWGLGYRYQFQVGYHFGRKKK